MICAWMSILSRVRMSKVDRKESRLMDKEITVSFKQGSGRPARKISKGPSLKSLKLRQELYRGQLIQVQSHLGKESKSFWMSAIRSLNCVSSKLAAALL